MPVGTLLPSVNQWADPNQVTTRGRQDLLNLSNQGLSMLTNLQPYQAPGLQLPGMPTFTPAGQPGNRFVAGNTFGNRLGGGVVASENRATAAPAGPYCVAAGPVRP